MLQDLRHLQSGQSIKPFKKASQNGIGIKYNLLNVQSSISKKHCILYGLHIFVICPLPLFQKKKKNWSIKPLLCNLRNKFLKNLGKRGYVYVSKMSLYIDNIILVSEVHTSLVPLI